MSLPKPDLHVRVNDDAMALLDALATVRGIAKAELAGELLERTLLGEGHAIRVAAARLVRSGFCGSGGERVG